MNKQYQIRVWDPLVRIFHWSLVISFFVAYFTEEDLLDLHVYVGYLIIGLVLFRLVWGVVGSTHARFSDFVCRPSMVVAYLKDVVKFRASRYLGHNPGGGAMIIALLLMLVLTSITGLALYGGEESLGPLVGMMASAGEQWVEALEEMHEFFANFALLLVFLHVAGVIIASLQHHENLVCSMITGYKRKENSP